VVSSFIGKRGQELASEIVVADIFEMIRARKWIVVTTTILITLPVCVYAFLTPRVYEVEAMVFPVAASSASSAMGSILEQFGGIASIAGLSPPDDDKKKEALAILNSRALAEDFILEKDLIKEFFQEDWDSVSKTWSVAGDDIPTIRDAYEKFDEEIMSIENDRETGMVRIAVRWSDRHLAADWVNEFIKKADQELLVRAKNEAERSIEFLYTELDKTQNAGLKQVVYGLIQNQIETIMMANVKEEYAFRMIDPAVVADEDGYVWPMEAVLILLAVLAGIGFGCILAILAMILRSSEYQDQ